MKKDIIIVFVIMALLALAFATYIMTPFLEYAFPDDFEIALSPDEVVGIEIVEIDENDNLTILKELSADSGIIDDLENLKCYRVMPPEYSFVGKGVLITYSNNRYELITDLINSYYEGESNLWGDRDKSDWDCEAFMGTEFNDLISEYLTE